MRAIAAVGAAAILMATAPAHAETIVGLLDVRGEGDVTELVLERFGAAIEEGLAGGDDITPAPRVRMTEMLSDSAWSPACTVGPCLAEVRAQTGADRVVTAGIVGSGQSYRFTITLAETETGRVLAQVSETCAACTVDDVASSATLATIALMNGAGETRILEPPADPGELAALERRVGDHARWARRTGLLFVGAALLAAGASYYFLDQDDDELGYPLAGAAAGLAISGTVMLGLSLRF